MVWALELDTDGRCRQSRRHPTRVDRRDVLQWRQSRHRRCSTCAQPSLGRPVGWQKYPLFLGLARPPRIVPDGARVRSSDAPPIQLCTLRTTLPQLSGTRPPCADRSGEAGRSRCVVPLKQERNDARVQDDHPARSLRTSRPSRIPRMNSSTSKGSLVRNYPVRGQILWDLGHSRRSRHQEDHSTSGRR